MAAAAVCFVGMIVAAVAHAAAVAITLLVLVVVFALTAWMMLLVKVRRLKSDANQMVELRQQRADQAIRDAWRGSQEGRD
jgi:hypothetical protein